jgi:hypothetical protein
MYEVLKFMFSNDEALGEIKQEVQIEMNNGASVNDITQIIQRYNVHNTLGEGSMS